MIKAINKIADFSHDCVADIIIVTDSDKPITLPNFKNIDSVDIRNYEIPISPFIQPIIFNTKNLKISNQYKIKEFPEIRILNYFNFPDYQINAFSVPVYLFIDQLNKLNQNIKVIIFNNSIEYTPFNILSRKILNKHIKIEGIENVSVNYSVNQLTSYAYGDKFCTVEEITNDISKINNNSIYSVFINTSDFLWIELLILFSALKFDLITGLLMGYKVSRYEADLIKLILDGTYIPVEEVPSIYKFIQILNEKIKDLDYTIRNIDTIFYDVLNESNFNKKYYQSFIEQLQQLFKEINKYPLFDYLNYSFSDDTTEPYFEDSDGVDEYIYIRNPIVDSPKYMIFQRVDRDLHFDIESYNKLVEQYKDYPDVRYRYKDNVEKITKEEIYEIFMKPILSYIHNLIKNQKYLVWKYDVIYQFGAGGVGYNIQLLLKYITQFIPIFSKSNRGFYWVYDKDKIEYHNLFRFIPLTMDEGEMIRNLENILEIDIPTRHIRSLQAIDDRDKFNQVMNCLSSKVCYVSLYRDVIYTIPINNRKSIAFIKFDGFQEFVDEKIIDDIIYEHKNMEQNVLIIETASSKVEQMLSKYVDKYPHIDIISIASDGVNVYVRKPQSNINNRPVIDFYRNPINPKLFWKNLVNVFLNNLMPVFFEIKP